MDYNRLVAGTAGYVPIRINFPEDGKCISFIKKLIHLPNYKSYSIHSDVDSIYEGYLPEEPFCRRYGGLLSLTILCLLLFLWLLYGALYNPRIYT